MKGTCVIHFFGNLFQDTFVDCPLFLLRLSQSFLGNGILTDLFEGCPFVHGHVISLVAFDQILRLVRRGADGVGLELDGGSDFFF